MYLPCSMHSSCEETIWQHTFEQKNYPNQINLKDSPGTLDGMMMSPLAGLHKKILNQPSLHVPGDTSMKNFATRAMLLLSVLTLAVSALLAQNASDRAVQR